MSEFNKGTEIAGRFVLSERLGRGANGEVWKATDKHAKRDVAIKVLVNADANEPSCLLHEAQKWASLEHENILRLYDIRTQDRLLIMECAEGGSLETMMRNNVLRNGCASIAPPCSKGEATKLFTDILRGLAFAHEKGILHGDIKPGNILLSRIGTAKMSDFGMAREERDGAFSLSPSVDRTGMSGTPDYMSPEQARREAVDRQSDIFSAGIVGFQLFTGRHPFCHPSLVLSAREIIAAADVPCPDTRESVPDVPERIASIISRMLAKDKSKRYTSVRQILAELDDESATAACANCGSFNAVRNRFCSHCGVALTRISTAEELAAPTGQATADDLVAEGFELARNSDWVGAIKSYRKALDIEPEHQKAHANLGYALNRLGLYDDALDVLTKALSFADHPAIYSYRAFAYKNLRRYQEALADLEKALEDRPNDPSILKEKAYCLVEMDQIEKAYEAVLLGLRHDRENERLLALRRRLEDTPEIRKFLGR